jgi:hypothetical protein
VASAGKGSRDEAQDREKGIALTMEEMKQKLSSSYVWIVESRLEQVRNFRVIRAPDSR